MLKKTKLPDSSLHCRRSYEKGETWKCDVCCDNCVILSLRDYIVLKLKSNTYDLVRLHKNLNSFCSCTHVKRGYTIIPLHKCGDNLFSCACNLRNTD